MRRRREGLPRDAAIALACRDRLRPILMTSLITIITMLPVAAAPRTGMDAYQPLGTVIVSGLLAGTLLSLLVIPIMHAVVDDLGNALRRGRVDPAAAPTLEADLRPSLKPALFTKPGRLSPRHLNAWSKGDRRQRGLGQHGSSDKL